MQTHLFHLLFLVSATTFMHTRVPTIELSYVITQMAFVLFKYNVKTNEFIFANPHTTHHMFYYLS